jgi:hypothetical protein
MAMNIRALLKRSKDEIQRSEEERTVAEHKAEHAEQKADRLQREKKTMEERALVAAGAGVTVLAAVPTAVLMRKVRQKVNLVRFGIDFGGVAAGLGLAGSVLLAMRKRADPVTTGAAAGTASGLAVEYALNRVDPVPPPQNAQTKTSGAEDEEETGAVDQRRRLSMREKLLRNRGDGVERIEVRDVIDMPTG